MPNSKILVVYYSRSGTTRTVAKALAARLNSSFEEIVETRGRGGFLGYWRSIIEARRKQAADIAPAKNDPSTWS